MEEQAQPPSAPTETQPVTQQPLRPHRGGVVLALGILGLVVCFILGIIAWVMGNKDLREIDAGTMDPSGRGLTKAGKICGMVSVILQLIGLVIWLMVVIFAGTSAVMSQ